MKRIAIVLLLALPLCGCFATETEIVTAADSVKLTGNSFVHDDEMAHQETTYTWDEASRGYLDEDRAALVRFGRLRGEAYLAQAQPLADVSETGRRIPVAGKVYMLSLIRVSPPRIHVQFAECHGMRDESPRLARSFGLELQDSKVAGGLRGSRAGILGFFLAGLACTPSTADIRIVPQLLMPGGSPLAPAAARQDTGQLVAYFTKVCDGGDVERCYKLGQMHLRGDGTPVNAARAAQLFEKVCDARNMGGCLDLALLVESGNGVTRDPARAAALKKQACAGGEPYACELLKVR